MKIYWYCCICGNTENVAMHHLNSLRSIKPSKRDRYEYVRQRLKRNQIPVCFNCHKDLTFGKYDKKNPIKLYNEFIDQL